MVGATHACDETNWRGQTIDDGQRVLSFCVFCVAALALGNQHPDNHGSVVVTADQPIAAIVNSGKAATGDRLGSYPGYNQ